MAPQLHTAVPRSGPCKEGGCYAPDLSQNGLRFVGASGFFSSASTEGAREASGKARAMSRRKKKQRQSPAPRVNVANTFQSGAF